MQRRRLLGALPGAAFVAAGAAPRAALAARALTDDAQRAVFLESTPARVFPAGPPASVFVYCIAPGKLLGWPRSVRDDEAALLLPEAARLPELGRLTGLNAEVLDEVGAMNVAQIEAPNLARVSFEQLLSWRPDWILASDQSFFRGLRAHPIWSRLEAVRAGRVLLVPRLPFGWFDAPPALNRIVGIVWLSAAFHPRLVGYRLDERIAEVFEWLYHRRPSLAQVRRLLGTQR